MKQSAGCLLYRRTAAGGWEVLIVHPSGNYNRRAPWSIPKGLVERGESNEAAARRETQEETGVVVGELASLGFVDYTKSRKRIHCFAGPLPADAAPTCASWEIDQARLFAPDEAKQRLHPEQAPLVDRLAARLVND